MENTVDTSRIVTLKSLKENGMDIDLESSNTVAINAKDITSKEVEDTVEVTNVIAKQFNQIDASFDRVKKDLIENVIPKGKELLYEAKLKRELEENKEESTPDKKVEEETPAANKEEAVTIDDDIDSIEDDIEEEDDAEEEIVDEEKDSKYTKEFYEQRSKVMGDEFVRIVKEKIKPIDDSNKIDLSKFSVKVKPVAYSKILARTAETKPKVHCSDWVLPTSKRVITLSEFSGADIEALDVNHSAQNALNSVKRLYSTIYAHVIDANKPDTLEEWTKTITAADIPHLMFNVFKASFENSCFVPFSCTNKDCTHVELIDYKIKDFVKFATEEDEKKFNKLLEKDSTSSTKIEETLVQVSSKYAFGLKLPSIYNVVFELTALDREFAERYSTILSNASFINNIYYINKVDSSLDPISFAPKSDDLRATVKNKLKIINKIFKELTSDQYMTFVHALSTIKTDDINMTYHIPGKKCAKCGHSQPEYEVDSPLELVFTRHQLTLLANS